MRLEFLRKKTLLTGSHLSLTPSICFLVSLMMILSMLLAGCATNNSDIPVSQDDGATSGLSQNLKEIGEDEFGLPDLYSGLEDTPLSSDMNPVNLDGHNPFLPFPSDVFAYRDETSPSGVRLKITNDQFPPDIKKILEKIPKSLQMDALYKEPDGADVDGFSISTNVLFEFDREVDPAWVGDVDENMARDGGDTFYLMDLTTGEFIPALANQSHFAKDPHRTTRDYVMQVMARKRFEHGRRYMAFVTKNFKDKDGNDFSCSSGFDKAKSQNGSAISEFYEPWLKYLESEKGINRDEILAGTIFTTRSRKSSIGPIVDIYKTVLKDEFTDEHVRIHNNMYFPYLNLERIIYGRINMRDYRNEEGVIDYKAGFKGTRDKDVSDWVPFLLFIPHHSFPKPYPVNIAGSGIVMSKEMMIIVAMANASLGVATMSIDWPSHWERDWAEGWSVLEGIGFVPGGIKKDAADMPRLLSMFMQIPIDIMSTYRVLKTYFATSDKKGIRDLDTDNLSYSGYSLGVLSGVSAAACMPDLKGAFMSVGSVNFCKLLSSGRFLLGGPSMAMPEGLGGAWYAAAMTAIISQKGDMFDGLQFADGFRNGVPEMGAGPRPFVATYARNDGWVTTECGVSLMETAELPLIYSQPDVMPYDWNGFIDNLMGKGLENNLAEYDNYGMAEVTLFNNDFKINETFENLGIPQALYNLTGHDWYDISGTLEHAMNAFNGTTFYYLMNFINNVQRDGSADDFYTAAKDFGELTAKGK
ncbi:MAG: hypothetical protein KJ737_21945 [Proteobacteria bacterium]|nr:hypothetical protein [Pseudomonadota bacterium]